MLAFPGWLFLLATSFPERIRYGALRDRENGFERIHEAGFRFRAFYHFRVRRLHESRMTQSLADISRLLILLAVSGTTTA
jgi:hypothetical protein